MTEATKHGAYGAGPHWSVRVWRRLGFYATFDEALFDWRQDEKPGDLITTDTTVRISFLDRLRVLLSGHVSLTTYTKTENKVGRTESRSQFCVMPP